MKRFAAVFPAMALLFLLASCGAAPTPLLDLSGLRDESGHFVPKNTAWHASAQEAKQSLGTAIGMPKSTAASGPNTYIKKNAVDRDGHVGRTYYTFGNDGLWKMGYIFEDREKDLGELFDSVSAELLELYGEPDFSGLNKGVSDDTYDSEAEMILWTEGRKDSDAAHISMLYLSKFFIEGEPASVTITMEIEQK